LIPTKKKVLALIIYDTNSIHIDFTIAEFEEKASESYLQAIEKLNTREMHLIYIKFCVERINLNSKFLNNEVFIKQANVHFQSIKIFYIYF
jgi:hypothetical protein